MGVLDRLFQKGQKGGPKRGSFWVKKGSFWGLLGPILRGSFEAHSKRAAESTEKWVVWTGYFKRSKKGSKRGPKKVPKWVKKGQNGPKRSILALFGVFLTPYLRCPLAKYLFLAKRGPKVVLRPGPRKGPRGPMSGFWGLILRGKAVRPQKT